MKGFLLDENLPHQFNFELRLPVIHATELGASPTDTQIWRYAQKEQLVIVSKDADFSDRVSFNPRHPGWSIYDLAISVLPNFKIDWPASGRW